MSPDEFQSLIDTYGADPARWPESHREQMLAFGASNAAARAVLREAQALDRVLAAAPRVEPARLHQIQSRILAAAAASPRVTAIEPVSDPDPTVVPLRPRKPPARTADPTPDWRETWHMGGLLAASLVLGLFIGSSLMGPNTIDVLRGVDREATADVVAALWGDGLTAAMDEDGP